MFYILNEKSNCAYQNLQKYSMTYFLIIAVLHSEKKPLSFNLTIIIVAAGCIVWFESSLAHSSKLVALNDNLHMKRSLRAYAD